jgi:hypothetical protein
VASEWHFAGLVFEADWIEAWGTWVGGLGTIGTLIYAIVALRKEADRRREDVKQAKDQQREAHDTQARTVVLHDPALHNFAHEAGAVGYIVQVGNYGTLPITNITGKLTYRPKQWVVPEVEGCASHMVVLPPKHDGLMWRIPVAELELPSDGQPQRHVDLFDVEVQFTDAYGTRWALRYGRGEQPSRVYDVRP